VKDPLAIGLGALAAGAGLGGATIVAGLVIVRAFERQVSVLDYSESAADPVLAALLAGLGVAATFGWRRSRRLDSVTQRGVIGVLAAVGALLAGFLAVPVERLLGLWGLTLWALAAGALGIGGSAWAVRGGRDDALPGGP